jgi:hypothetical protein
MRRGKRRESVNPFIALTDVLFNVILVFIFASAIFAQDISRKYAENKAFQDKLASLQLERDTLISNVENLTGALDTAAAAEDKLQEAKLSLEEQLAILVNNLDAAQVRQQDLTNRISVILGDLGDADMQKRFLEEKITVVLGELDIAESEKKLLEDKVTVVLGDLSEAELNALTLRNQVSELSRNNFLVIELEWLTESHDLDLHVTDPAGNRFYWNQATYPSSTARLTLDNRIGARPNKPGLEIWTARELQLGTYRVEVGLWGCGRTNDSDGYKPCQADGSASVLVRHRDKDEVIENVRIPLNQSYARLSGQNFALNEESLSQLVLVAEVEVFEDEGEVRVRVKPAPGL